MKRVADHRRPPLVHHRHAHTTLHSPLQTRFTNNPTAASLADIQQHQTTDAVGDSLSLSWESFSLPYCLTNVVLSPAPPDVNIDVSVPRAAVTSGEKNTTDDFGFVE